MSLIPAIRSSSTEVRAVPSASPQSTSPKRQKSEEPVNLSFDVELISMAIFSQLLDTSGENREQRVANQLSVSNVEFMLQLSVCRPSVVMKIFTDYLQISGYEAGVRASMRMAVDHLCILSVLNSKYQETMVILENKIADHLAASKQERFHEIIGSAQKHLAAPIIKRLGKLQEHSGALRQLEADISEALNLFYYVSADSQECIEILARETKLQNGALRYPLCWQYFKRLCQNLNLLSNEKLELVRLQTQLRAKQSRMDAEIKLLLEAQESKETRLPSTEMIPLRDRFCNENISLIWTVGGELLKRVFTATLAYKKAHQEQCYAQPFPHGLLLAINKSAALNSSWEKFHFNQLFPKKGSIPPFPEFDVSFVWDVWGNYAKEIDHLTDLGCFMRQFINELPEESFQKLANVPKENRGKALERAFFQKFKKSATFTTLKDWALTLKPLRE